MEGFAIKIKEMKIDELDEFLENEEPFSDFFVLVQDDEHRELLEENYIFVPELGIDIHIGIWENWNEEVQEFETDFDFYCFRDSVILSVKNLFLKFYKEIVPYLFPKLNSII